VTIKEQRSKTLTAGTFLRLIDYQMPRDYKQVDKDALIQTLPTQLEELRKVVSHLLDQRRQVEQQQRQIEQQRKWIEQQQRTTQQFQASIQEIQRRNEDEKKSLQEVIAEKNRALALKDLEQEKLKKQANWEVEARIGERRRLGQEIESLKEKLVAQQQQRDKLQETVKQYHQQLQELRNAHQSQKEAQSLEIEEENDLEEGVVGNEIEIEEDEEGYIEEEKDGEEEEEEEYNLVKLGRYLLLLLQETRKAIDIGRNRQSPHVKFFCICGLPYHFVLLKNTSMSLGPL
jgi:chromosome segregation ATPase